MHRMRGEGWIGSLDRWELPLLVAVLLLATTLRVTWPTLTEFKFSEARLEALALDLMREGRLPLVGVPSSAGFDHSPVSVYLYVPAFLLTANPIPATIYGGLVGVAAVALCWWLARRWPGGGRWAALVASLLFAVSPWSVAFSRKIWQVAFVPLLALGFVGLMVSALIAGRRWHLAWAFLIYALLVQVHPSAVSLAPAVLLWLILFRREVKLGPLLVGGALGALSVVPFLVHQVQSGWPALTALRALPVAVWDLSAVWLGWEAITGRGIHALAGNAYPLLRVVPRLGWTFHLIGWLTVAAGLWLAWRLVGGWRASDTERWRGARVDLILLSWLVVPMTFNLRHSLDLHLHFFALLMPAAYLIIGRAAQALFEGSQQEADGRSRPSGNRRTARDAASHAGRICGLALLGLLCTAQVVALVLMARFVASHDTPGGFGTPLGHYLDVVEQAVALAQDSGAAEVLVVGQGDSVVVDETPAIFDVLLRDRVAYRFVDGRSAAVFPPQRAVALLTAKAEEAATWYRPWPMQNLQKGYRLVALDGSWPQGDLEEIGGPRVFQNGVELQAHGWEGEAAPASWGRFWLLWQVLWLSPDDTHFFVHLLDEQGQVQGQQDAVGYPAAGRKKGDRIISKFDINISEEGPIGSYWARVGLYLYPQVVNVPVIDGAGNPVAEAILLGPLGEGR